MIHTEDLLESIQRKALRITFDTTEYADAMAIASLDTVKGRGVADFKRFIINARQHPHPLMKVIPSPTYHEWEYPLRHRNPRPAHGRTNELNDFGTVKCLYAIVYAFLLAYPAIQSMLHIEDITWPRGDANFIFECWKFYLRDTFSTRR